MNVPANFQPIPNSPSGAASYSLSPKAKPFVQDEESTVHRNSRQRKKRRSQRRRRSAGNTETSPNNVLDEASGMAKTPTVDGRCETKTLSLADLNRVSKTKTPKENSSDDATQRENYTVHNRYVERKPERKTKLTYKFDELVMDDGRKRDLKSQATNASASVIRVFLVRLRR